MNLPLFTCDLATVPMLWQMIRMAISCFWRSNSLPLDVFVHLSGCARSPLLCCAGGTRRNLPRSSLYTYVRRTSPWGVCLTQSATFWPCLPQPGCHRLAHGVGFWQYRGYGPSSSITSQILVQTARLQANDVAVYLRILACPSWAYMVVTSAACTSEVL